MYLQINIPKSSKFHYTTPHLFVYDFSATFQPTSVAILRAKL